jgi:hypothetical protein
MNGYEEAMAALIPILHEFGLMPKASTMWECQCLKGDLAKRRSSAC